MKWFWMHPVNGGAILVAMNNVCYFFGKENGTTEFHLANGEVIEVIESEQYFLDVFNNV